MKGFNRNIKYNAKAVRLKEQEKRKRKRERVRQRLEPQLNEYINPNYLKLRGKTIAEKKHLK
jgi:protein tyrosine phosphatase